MGNQDDGPCARFRIGRGIPESPAGHLKRRQVFQIRPSHMIRIDRRKLVSGERRGIPDLRLQFAFSRDKTPVPLAGGNLQPSREGQLNGPYACGLSGKTISMVLTPAAVPPRAASSGAPGSGSPMRLPIGFRFSG